MSPRMKAPLDNDPPRAAARRIHLLQTLSRIAAAVPLLIGAAVLVGWEFDIAILKSVLPGMVTMKANTAAGLILAGAALGLLGLAPPHPWARLLAQICASATILLGLLTLVEYLTDWNLCLDQLLFTEPAGTVGTLSPGRMSPFTTLDFVLLGSAALLAGFRRLRFAARLLALLGALIAIVPLLGYLFGASALIGLAPSAQIAVHTAAAFIILSAGLLFAQPAAGSVTVAAGGAGSKRMNIDRTPLDAQEAEEAEKRSFELGLLVATAALAAVITVLGFLYFKFRQFEIEKGIFEELGTIADLKDGQIASWRDERLGDARMVVKTPFFAQTAAAFFADPDSASKRAVILTWFDALRRIYPYKEISLVDARGRVRLSVPGAADISDPQLHALLDAPPRSQDALISDLHIGGGGDIHIDVVAPLWAAAAPSPDLAAGEAQTPAAIIGAIVLRIDPREVLYPLIQSWPTPSRTAETLLVRREGGEVVYLNELRHRRGTALVLRRSLRDQQLPAAMGAMGRCGVSEGIDYRGVKVLAAMRAIPGSNWIMVAKVDQAEVYGPLREEAWMVGLVTAALLLSSAGFAGFLWRLNATRILHRTLVAEKERKAATERLALITQYANDVIFLMDAEGRVIEANDRALSTYGYTIDEFRRLPPGGLRAPEEIAGLPQQLELFALPDGSLFETVHQRKDGKAFPVEISGRAVEIDGRQFKLSVVRDITERKQAEEESRREDARSRSISAILQYRAEKTQEFLDFALEEAIKLTKSELGYICFYYEDRKQFELNTWSRDVIEERTIPNPQTCYELEKTGIWGEAVRQRRPILLNDFQASHPLKKACPEGDAPLRRCLAIPVFSGDRIVAVAAVANKEREYDDKDIEQMQLLMDAAWKVVEQRNAVEALRQSEAKLRSVLDATPFPIAIVDLQDDRIHYWSSSALTLFGHTAPTAMEWYRIAYPDPEYRRTVVARWRPCLETARKSGRTVNAGEYRITCRDGSARVCELHATFLAENLIVTFNDITARKRADEQIRQQLDELRRWYEVTLGREDRIRELKHEVNDLYRRFGETPRYGGGEMP